MIGNCPAIIMSPAWGWSSDAQPGLVYINISHTASSTDLFWDDLW